MRLLRFMRIITGCITQKGSEIESSFLSGLPNLLLFYLYFSLIARVLRFYSILYSLSFLFSPRAYFYSPNRAHRAGAKVIMKKVAKSRPQLCIKHKNSAFFSSSIFICFHKGFKNIMTGINAVTIVNSSRFKKDLVFLEYTVYISRF